MNGEQYVKIRMMETDGRVIDIEMDDITDEMIQMAIGHIGRQVRTIVEHAIPITNVEDETPDETPVRSLGDPEISGTYFKTNNLSNSCIYIEWTS